VRVIVLSPTASVRSTSWFRPKTRSFENGIDRFLCTRSPPIVSQQVQRFEANLSQ